MIFVVEDDHGVRELELYALHQSGYEAEGFETPAAFRQALEKTVPDCVLLDVMLPGEDGLSLLRFLRRDARTRRVPVILVTARDAEMDKVKPRRADDDMRALEQPADGLPHAGNPETLRRGLDDFGCGQD